MDQELPPSISSIRYNSSVEALHELLGSCHIIDISTHLSRLANGVEYSFVEVTCSDGTQYGLQAYGKEALELNRVARENILKEQAVKEKDETHPIVLL